MKILSRALLVILFTTGIATEAGSKTKPAASARCAPATSVGSEAAAAVDAKK